MKKTCFLLLVCIVGIGILLCGCNATQGGNDSNNENINTQKNEIAEDVFIIDGGVSDELKLAFAVSENYGLNTDKELKVLADSEQMKKFPLCNEELSYRTSWCQFKDGNKAEYGSFYCVYDEYLSEKAIIRCLRGTDIITYFSDLTVKSGYSDNDVALTEEQAKEIADNFAKKIISEKELEKYVCEISIGEKKPNTFTFPYSITYYKFIDKYKTDEYIWVTLNGKGEVTGYNGEFLHKYDDIENKLTKEMLDRTKEKLIAKLESLELNNLTYKTPTITTNTSGEPYMSITFEYEGAQMQQIMLAIR